MYIHWEQGIHLEHVIHLHVFLEILVAQNEYTPCGALAATSWRFIISFDGHDRS